MKGVRRSQRGQAGGRAREGGLEAEPEGDGLEKAIIRKINKRKK